MHDIWLNNIVKHITPSNTESGSTSGRRGDMKIVSVRSLSVLMIGTVLTAIIENLTGTKFTGGDVLGIAYRVSLMVWGIFIYRSMEG